MTREIGGEAMPFLVEQTRDDCVHACTVDDVAAMLRLLPRPDVMGDDWLDGIQGVVLRQPTRKEESHVPVWARIGYSVPVSADEIGPVIFIEAQEVPFRGHWGNSVGPSDRRELDRLIAMATSVERARRGHTLHFDLEGIRRVQLFHSVPHELGHSVDMMTKVDEPSRYDIEEWRRLVDRYFQRPVVEREEFAHRYAERAMAELRARGSAPFDRMLDPDALTSEGLRLEDFVAIA
ncbi:MAG: hypothetical protein AAF957_09640 [Planctomycetota bacterium]